MKLEEKELSLDASILNRSSHLFQDKEHKLFVLIDQFFAKLLFFQWLAAIFCAVIISPRTWEGEVSSIHIHLWAAIFLGGLINIFPIALAWKKPGHALTRHIIAVAQMLMGGLLIHLTGGRIETHFHVFGSLAFLMFYRDWKVLITATIIVASDHFFRGLFYPQSVYGVLSVQPWRWLEHAGWVLFEDFFLISACVISRREMQNICLRQAKLEMTNSKIEMLVSSRTKELEETHRLLDEQRIKSVNSTKMSALGEMAGGIAHEINNPLTIISGNIFFLKKMIKTGKFDEKLFNEYVEMIGQTVLRISKITQGLLSFSRNEEGNGFHTESIKNILEQTIILCSEKFKNHGITLAHNLLDDDLTIECQPIQISQVILNLLNNAHDAIKELKERWLSIEVVDLDSKVEIKVTDSGKGIPVNIRDKIMQPFFTSKKIGEGTGLGLSVSLGIIMMHGGEFFLDNECPNTQFVIRLPKLHVKKEES